MKKNLVSLILIFTMVVSSVSAAFASTVDNGNIETATMQSVADLLDQAPELGGVVNDALETSKDFIYEANDTEIVVPKTGEDFIETIFDAKQNRIGMKLPEEVSTAEAIKTTNGTMVYNSACENIDVLVQMLRDEENGFIFSSVRTMVLIKDATAPKQYDFTFELPEGASLITTDEYKQTYYPENNDWIGDDLVFIIDKDGNILSTIDEAWAKDANGEKIETFYKINGNVLTQVVNFDSTNAFPVIADPTNTGVKTKVETLSFTNTKTNINKLIQARREINERQNSTLTKVISLINSVFGLFNTVTGVMTMVISGVMGGNAAFLEKCEDTYTRIQEGFTQNEFSSAEIYFTYRGTYQGQNKGYVYQVQSVTNNRVTV